MIYLTPLPSPRRKREEDRSAETGTTELTTTESAQPPNQPRSPSHHRINPDRQATTESTGFVLQQKTQKTTLASPSHHRINHHHAGNRKPQKLFVLHNRKPQKIFRGERNFRASKTPKNFQTKSFVCSNRKSQRAKSKEIKESREKKREKKFRKK